MAPPPRHPTASFPLTPMATGEEADSRPIFVGDTLNRVGRLEQQADSMLPILGKVAEAVDNMATRFEDLSKDVKDVMSGFVAFRIETASYGNRLSELEERSSRHDTRSLEDLERAKLKAEAILEANKLKAEAVVEVARKEQLDKRNRFLTIVGTAAVSVITAALITWLKLR